MNGCSTSSLDLPQSLRQLAEENIIKHCNKSFHSIYRKMKICTTECKVTQLFKWGNISQSSTDFFPRGSILKVLLLVPIACQPCYLELHPFHQSLVIVRELFHWECLREVHTKMANTDLLCVAFGVKDQVSYTCLKYNIKQCWIHCIFCSRFPPALSGLQPGHK